MIPYFTFQKINLEIVTIHTWGFLVFLGFLIALFFSIKEGKKAGIAEENIWDVMIISLVGVIIGSRFFYVISNYDKFKNLFDVLNIYNNGGFSFLGGAILAIIFIIIYAKNKKLNIYRLGDVLVPGALMAIIMTRLGCFLIYDHLGKITNLPWGREYLDHTIRHPIALYHLFAGIITLSLILYFKKRKIKDGFLILLFIFFYAIFRFLIDFTRCSDLVICNNHYLNLTYVQWILLISSPISCYFLFKNHFLDN